MGCIRGISAGALVLGALVASSAGQTGRSFTDRPVPGMRQMDRHNPFSPAYVDLTPGGFARRQTFGPAQSVFYTGGSFCGPFDYGSCGPGPSFDCGYYCPPSFDCDYGPIVYPPLIGAEPWFAPGPAMNMFGGGAAVAPPANVPIAPGVNGIGKPPARPRASNAEAVARAARYLSAGDEHFAAQRYRDANARFRTATQTAPDLVEAFFRQGQALLASGQFDLAGKAFKRGLRLGDKWPQASFDLVELYGDNQVAKAAHMEAVADAAGDAPQDGTLLLLVALQLYFDGQQERSLPFFRKAADALAEEDLNLDAVLKARV